VVVGVCGAGRGVTADIIYSTYYTINISMNTTIRPAVINTSTATVAVARLSNPVTSTLLGYPVVRSRS